MSCDITTIYCQRLDLIFPESSRSMGMMESSVGVCFPEGSEFPSLLPVSGAFSDGQVQAVGAGLPEVGFTCRESSALLVQIKKGNNKFAILKAMWWGFLTPGPNLCCIPRRLERAHEITSSVGDTGRTVPGREDRWEEIKLGEPRVFKTKGVRFWDGSGQGDNKGHMIRGGSSDGSERGIWEGCAHGIIEKNSVKTGKSG